MEQRAKVTRRSGYLSTTGLFILGGAIIGGATYISFIPPNLRIILKVGMLAASLVAWLLLRGKPKYLYQKEIAAGFFSLSVGVLLAQYLANIPLRYSGLSTSTLPGIAIAKFSEAFLIVLPILVLHFATGGERDGLFLTGGNLKLGLIAGFIGLAVFVGISAIQAMGLNLAWSTVFGALPWILIFILSNAFMEELVFRALFFNKLEPVVGWPTTLLATSFVFALVHISSTYVLDILLFMVLLMALALLWAWLMRKANSIWGPVLIHAGADVLVMVGFLAGAG